MTNLSEPVTISEWPRNSRETIRVRLDHYQGNVVVDLRTWFPDAAGEWRPGRSGLTLGVRHLPALATALATALVEAQQRHLV